MTSAAKRINATEAENVIVIIIFNFYERKSPSPSAARVWQTR